MEAPDLEEQPGPSQSEDNRIIKHEDAVAEMAKAEAATLEAVKVKGLVKSARSSFEGVAFIPYESSESRTRAMSEIQGAFQQDAQEKAQQESKSKELAEVAHVKAREAAEAEAKANELAAVAEAKFREATLEAAELEAAGEEMPIVDAKMQEELSTLKQEMDVLRHEVSQRAEKSEAAKQKSSLEAPDPSETSKVLSAQSIWLEKQLNREPSKQQQQQSPPRTFNPRLKLKAAINTVKVANRSRRRFADGTMRNSVREGAKAEAAESAHGHGPSGGMYWLSSRTQGFFERTYSSLGLWIAMHHKVAMLLGLLILVSGIPGTFFLSGEANFLWFKVDADLHAFALTSTTQYKQYESIVHEHDGVFHPPRPALLVFSPQPNSRYKVLSYDFMTRALDIMNNVYNLTIQNASGTEFGFSDLCQLRGDAPDRHEDDHREEEHADINYCSSLALDMFSTPVNWDQERLLEYAPPYDGEGDGRENGRHDYARVLEMRDEAWSLGTYTSFNATGVYNTALRYVNASDPYTIWTPTTMQIPVILEYSSDKDRTALLKSWETRMAKYLTSGEHPHASEIRVSTIVESTFESAMQDGLYQLTPWLFVVVGVMVIYSGVFLSTQVRTAVGEATQFSLIAQGSAVSGLAGFSAFGWIYYIGLEKINVLCICAVFLVAAVGVDCTFIFVSAMKAAGPDVTVEEAMPMAMSEGASAITLTSLTSVCAFAVSAIASSEQPAFKKFNLTMAIALTLNFIGFILFFAGWQVQNEHRIAHGKGDLMPLMPRPKGKIPDWVDIGSKLRNIINSKYAPLMPETGGPKFSTPCKLIGATVMIATFVISCVFVGSIGVGMPDEYLVPDTSYLYGLTRDFTELTNATRTAYISMHVEVCSPPADTQPPPHKVLANLTASRPTLPTSQHLDIMHAPKLKSFGTDVLEKLVDRDDVISVSCLPGLYLAYTLTQNALRRPVAHWQIFLNSTGSLGGALYGRSHYGEEHGQYSRQIVPEAFVCTITTEISSAANSTPRIAAMDSFTNFSATLNAAYNSSCFPCDATRVTFYAKDWAMKTSFDKELPSLVWFTIALALVVVGVVLLLALPVHRAAVSVLNIFLVVFAIIGFMGYAGVTYNLISYCTLTMAIGFCVDYTVELMHFSVIGNPKDSMGLKFSNALKACGYDVLHGCGTAMIGVLILGLSGAEYARLFSYLSLIMCFYGGTYALWSLPSSMTLCSMIVHKLTGKGFS